MLPNIYRHSCNLLTVKKCLLSPTARRRRDEVRQDFCQHRRSGEFGYHSSNSDGPKAGFQQQQQGTLDPRLEVRSDILHNVPRSGRLGGGRCPSDDWRSVGGGGRGRRDRCYGDVELTDFGLIDYPRLSAAEKVSNSTGGGGGNSKSPATSVRKGLLWVQKDRFFSRYTGFVSVFLETSVLLYNKRLISSHSPDGYQLSFIFCCTFPIVF